MELKRGTILLQGSSATGSHLLQSRTKQVEAGVKAVKDAFNNLLKEEDEFDEIYIAEVDQVLAAATASLDEAARWADNIDDARDARKEAVSSRPRLTYSPFNGEVSEWHRFVGQVKQVRLLFQEDQAQALTVTLGFCGPKIQNQIKKFQGKPNGLDNAMASLQRTYGIPHLAIPSIEAALRAVRPATKLEEVTGVCQKLTAQLESLATMMPREDTLETALTHEIFHKVFLSPPELHALVPTLEMGRVSLGYILDFVNRRWRDYELLKRTILRPSAGAETKGALGFTDTGGATRTPKKKKERNVKKKGTEQKDTPPLGPPAPEDKVKEGRSRKCFYCVSRKLADTEHHFTSCTKVGPAQKAAVAKLGHCTDCLAARLDGHLCNRLGRSSGQLKIVYCMACSCNIKFCVDQSTHAKSAIPETTAGCLGLTSDNLAFAATLKEVRRQDMQALKGLEDATPGSANKGNIGRPASLYSVITLVNGQDKLKINALIDPGSESSYYNPDIEAFAVRSEPRSFKIETLSLEGSKPSVHQGVMSSFIVEMAQGQRLQVDLLKHTGLKNRSMKLRPKLLTVSQGFAMKHQLQKHGLVHPDICQLEDDDAILINGGKLMAIIGQDLYHLQPTIVDSYIDTHGRVDLWYCKFKDQLVASGNRSWPVEDSDLDSILKQHSVPGTSGRFCAVRSDDDSEAAPLTSLLGALNATAGLPTARVAAPQPALHHLDGAGAVLDTPAGAEEEPVAVEDPGEDPNLLQQVRTETAKTLLASGVCSEELHSRLERFAYQDPQPEHRLQESCLTCRQCKACMEDTSGESHYHQVATEGFRAHCLKIRLPPPATTADLQQIPARFAMKIKYLKLPGSSLPGLNLLESYSRHCSLRRALAKLPASTQEEFSAKLTAGMKKGYWREVPDFDVRAHMEKEMTARTRALDGRGTMVSAESPGAPTHFLPTGVVLKEDARANTRARLVLDPSRSVNTKLITPPNLENTITATLRRLASLPILAFADISEAFWRIRLDAACANDLCFLMDLDTNTGRLTASLQEGAGTRLVALRTDRSVMGVTQSPAFLSISKVMLAEDLHKVDETLAYHIKKYSYVDDLGSGLTTQELAQVEGIFQQDHKPCSDRTCCGPERPKQEDLLVQDASPEDELRAVRHLFRSQTGRIIAHRLAMRIGLLEFYLRERDMPTRGICCSLEGTVCKVYLNSLVLHYARLYAQGRKPELSDMSKVPLPEGWQVQPAAAHRWFRPWKAVDPARVPPPGREDADPIIRILGPPAKQTPSIHASPDQSTLLGYLWDPATDTLATSKLPYVNLLKCVRGVRPLGGRLYSPEDVVKLHHKIGLTITHSLSAAHNVFDPLNIVVWAAVQLKYCYRLSVVDSPPDATYKTKLSNVFVRNHLAPGVGALLHAKRHLAQHRSWRLPPCVNYDLVTAELAVLCDGAFGVLSGSGALSYLVQRYTFAGQARAKVHLYGGSTQLAPLNKPRHQVHAEMAAADLAQKEGEKARKSLAEAGLQVKPHMISDSRTALTICTKMSVSLELGAALIVSRVQQTFSHHRMYHTSGDNLLTNVDLLTRYDVDLYKKITSEFYNPSWLHLPLDQQPIVKVTEMTKVEDPFLPYQNPHQMIFSHIGNSDQPGLLAAAEDPSRGVSTTGSGWKRQPACQSPCLACKTGEPSHPHDVTLLLEAGGKRQSKRKKKTLGYTPSTTAAHSSTMATLGLSVDSNLKAEKPRKTAKAARSGLSRPLSSYTDTNPFRELLERRWGYTKAVRVMARAMSWAGPGPHMDRALIALFAGEHANSSTFATLGRRGNSIYDLEERQGVVLARGRDLAPAEPGQPSVLAQEEHLLFADQQTAYLVPLLHASTALAKAVVEEVHLGRCGESEATLCARVSRYFHLTGSALLTCQKVSDSCYGCKRVKGRRGADKIRPLRNIGPADLTEGGSVQLDTAGPFIVHLQAKQVQAARTRSITEGRKRTTVKRWALLAVDPYSHRLECSELEDMSTSSMIGACQEIFASNGWSTTRLCLDPGSSLAPGALKAMQARADSDEEAPHEDEVLEEGARQRLVAGLAAQGFQLRPAYSKSPWRQGMVEATVGSFKKVLYATLKPGTTDLTVSNFGRTIRLCAAILNGRPVVLLPHSGRHPEEGVLCSPTSLRGPSHASWKEMAASRDARGQYAIIKRIEAKFQQNWATFYSKRLRSNTKLASNHSPAASWPEGSVVLVTDLASPAGRLHPYPRLGRLVKYLDEERNHAWISTTSPSGQACHVDRPIGRLVYLASHIDHVPQQGLYFDPMLEGDRAAVAEEADPQAQPEEEEQKASPHAAPQPAAAPAPQLGAEHPEAEEGPAAHLAQPEEEEQKTPAAQHAPPQPAVAPAHQLKGEHPEAEDAPAATAPPTGPRRSLRVQQRRGN